MAEIFINENILHMESVHERVGNLPIPITYQRQNAALVLLCSLEY
jgi:hypothetical protein